MKGAKAHRGRGFASISFKPSAEADGKRETDGALRIADTAGSSAAPCQGLFPHLMRDRKETGGIGHPKRKRSFLRKA